MGTFGGHALPGSFLICAGIWYTISTIHKYFDAKQRREKFKSSLYYPFFFLPHKLQKIPLEPMLRLIMITTGIVAIVLDSVIHSEPFRMNNRQHVTFFVFFGQSAVIDLLLFYGVSLPMNAEYISQIVNLGVNAFLFKHHVYGRNDLDVLLHTLLVYVILITLVGVVLEMKYRDNILCAMTKCFGYLFQGTWFWQLGFILYPQFSFQALWEPSDHAGLMLVALIFTWHIAANCFLMAVIGFIMSGCYRQNHKTVQDDDTSSRARLILED
ncbi:transmembrane protein 45B-like [Saccostrea cucullata]|uniref:transmembrane protein 45B-like n=1 Tax=Saccostrea cuccullata TaxID=36930 RepID=UPI002ED4432A